MCKGPGVGCFGHVGGRIEELKGAQGVIQKNFMGSDLLNFTQLEDWI